MAIFLKKFETMSQYNAYTADTENFILPNVSLTVDNSTVHYNPSTPPTPTETRLVCKYNVEDTSSETTLFYDTTNFSAMEIDGVEQAEVVSYYQFDTIGEHTVKYTLTDTASIGESAFTYCYSLTSIDIPSGVTSIGESAFNECRSLTSIVIPNSVTSIGDYAFQSCSGLTRLNSEVDGVYNIPSGVTSIGDGAFSSAYFTNVTIPDSVITIGEGAFFCYDLTTVIIGSGITNMGNVVFDECTNLISVTILASVPPTIGFNVFNYNAEGRKIYVPSGSVNAYKAAEGWEDWAEDIEPIQ